MKSTNVILHAIILLGIAPLIAPIPLKLWMDQPKENLWVTLAKATGTDTLCLSLTSAASPFRTCLVGVPITPGEWDAFVSQTRFRGAMPLNSPNLAQAIAVQVLNHEDRGWLTGRTWGVRLDRLYADPGEYITIKKQPLTVYSQPLGPNLEMKAFRDNMRDKEKEKAQVISAGSMPQQPKATQVPFAKVSEKEKVIPGGTETLLNMVEVSYRAINYTDPEMTESCWLCYDVRPPFYEGIGLNQTFSLSTEDDPSQCRWGERNIGLTMSQVSGQGMCIGHVPSDSTELCSTEIKELKKGENKWAIPYQGGWWICSKSGLVPCVSLLVFEKNNEFCIQITVLPHMLYRSEESVLESWEMSKHKIQKREPISVTIAMILGLGATGTGIASLVQHSHGLTALRAAVDEDLDRIEKSISYLETSLNSLSEVVLQNRRGLDLLFLQQGGLCVALGEECCFYASHSGVIKESMTKLREGIIQRKRERDTSYNWLDNWHNQFPWLTTLISTLAGPVLMLCATLIFGPCILNRVMNFIKDRVETVQLLTVKQQYEDMSGGSLEEDHASLLEIAKEAVIEFDQQIYEEIRRGDCDK
ncbi:MLV-related proviral Env polyprotein-like [Chiroxiphia lanceolata]|uniref:MLV-related proviral Env polyprotein-like n=1 Tax=Chiroxiphia lanceolata TaxID=296741 RepID=UPI0013CEA1EA|nr:MLV-related proviral Env polyprotein-like [Chiroxiphia lanceolata]